MSNVIHASSFSDLPHELFFTIMSFLDYRELVDFMSVGRSFRVWAFQFLLSYFHHVPSVSTFVDNYESCFKNYPSIIGKNELTRTNGYYSFGSDGKVNEGGYSFRSSSDANQNQSRLNFSFSNSYLMERMDEILKEQVFMSVLDLTRFRQLSDLIMKTTHTKNIMNRLVSDCGLRCLYLNYFSEGNELNRQGGSHLDYDVPIGFLSSESLNQLHVFHVVGGTGNPSNFVKHLINCRALNLTQHSLFSQSLFQSITNMKKLTHLSLNQVGFSSESGVLTSIFKCISSLSSLRVLEIISDESLTLTIQPEVENSLKSTHLQKLTIITQSIAISGTLSCGYGFLPQLQTANYCFSTSTCTLLPILVPSIQTMDTLMISESFPISTLFSKINVTNLVVWIENGKNLQGEPYKAEINYKNLFYGSRFKAFNRSNYTTDEITLATLTHAKSIESIHVTNVQFRVPNGLKMPYLTSLILDGCEVSMDNLRAVLEATSTTLERLILSRIDLKISNQGDVAMKLLFQYLREFRICSVNAIETLLSDWTLKLPSLERLELTDLYNTKGTTLVKFLLHSEITFSNLKEIKMKESPIVDQDLFTIFNKVYSSPHLSEIELYLVGPTIYNSISELTMEALQRLTTSNNYTRITALELPRFEVGEENFSQYFDFVCKLKSLKTLTINIHSIYFLELALNTLVNCGLQLEKLNIVLTDRLNINSNLQQNNSIRMAIHRLILSMRNLSRIILDWSPFDVQQLEEFKQEIRSSGKQPPRLVFPISSLTSLKKNQSGNFCQIQ